MFVLQNIYLILQINSSLIRPLRVRSCYKQQDNHLNPKDRF